MYIFYFPIFSHETWQLFDHQSYYCLTFLFFMQSASCSVSLLNMLAFPLSKQMFLLYSTQFTLAKIIKGEIKKKKKLLFPFAPFSERIISHLLVEQICLNKEVLGDHFTWQKYSCLYNVTYNRNYTLPYKIKYQSYLHTTIRFGNGQVRIGFVQFKH